MGLGMHCLCVGGKEKNLQHLTRWLSVVNIETKVWGDFLTTTKHFKGRKDGFIYQKKLPLN